MNSEMTTHLRQNPIGYMETAPQHVIAHLQDYRVVDVRSAEEYHGPLNHIPGAELTPLETLESRIASWDKTEALLVTCQSGVRSSMAAQLLVARGFTQVVNLMGGMLGWHGAGLPTAADQPQHGIDEIPLGAPSLHSLAQENSMGFRDITPVAANDHLSSFRVIDVRSQAEFNGNLSHMDGAELAPLDTLANATLGWEKGQSILLVCRSGGRSGMAAQLLAAQGFTELYNLTGGMMGWNRAGLRTAADHNTAAAEKTAASHNTDETRNERGLLNRLGGLATGAGGFFRKEDQPLS